MRLGGGACGKVLGSARVVVDDEEEEEEEDEAVFMFGTTTRERGQGRGMVMAD